MAKPTLQQRLVDALVASGRGAPVESRSLLQGLQG